MSTIENMKNEMCRKYYLKYTPENMLLILSYLSSDWFVKYLTSLLNSVSPLCSLASAWFLPEAFDWGRGLVSIIFLLENFGNLESNR